MAQQVAWDDSWRWAEYSVRDGLPSDRAVDLVESEEGVVWVTTSAGLAWHDGYRWNAAVELPSSDAVSIVPNGQGGIFALEGGRLYQGDEHGFLPVALRVEEQDLEVQSIAPLDGDLLLLTTSAELYRWSAGQLQPVPTPVQTPPDEWPHLRIGSTRHGSLWFSTRQVSFELEDEQWRPLLQGWLSLFEDGQSGERLLATRERNRSQGTLWTQGPGEPLRATEFNEPSAPISLDIGPAGDAAVLFVDRTVWVRHDGNWGRLALPSGRPGNPEFVRFRPNGDLWIGGAEGLVLYRRSLDRWASVTEPSAGENVSTNEILQARDGNLWVGTHEGLIIVEPEGRTRRVPSIDGEGPMSVTALGEDIDGHIWVGSGAGFEGAFRWDGRAWRHFGAEQGLTAQGVHRIAADRSGRLWFLGIDATVDDAESSSSGPGAFLYEEGQFKKWGVEEGLLSGRVYAFAEGPRGDRWFATRLGISRWADGIWTHWAMREGLKSPRVFTLEVARDGWVWFGHQDSGGGLGFIDADGEVGYLTMADGLVSDYVWEVSVAPDEAVWVGTASGLARYSDSSFIEFGPATGLDPSWIWPVLPVDDRVYVGAMGGGTHMLSFAEAAHPPPRVNVYSDISEDGDLLFRWETFPFSG